MTEESFISFIVIAYNEAANLPNCLSAIIGLADLGNYEIIVVNDGSRDSTAQIAGEIAQQNPNVRLIDLAENRGRGHARHKGVAAARGGQIATVDADIILPRDWLTQTRAALHSYDAVGGVAVPDGDVAYLYQRFKLAPRVVSGTTAVTGNNGLYRRAVFDITSFDESLREGEDSALNHAMAGHGLSAMTLPSLLVQHEEKKTLVTSLRWLFDVGRGATRQFLTYRQVRPPDLVTVAFAGSLTLGVCAAARKHRMLGAAIPVAFVLSASVQHVRSRFETPRSQWSRVAPAVAVDSAHLAAYFAGRLAGLAALTQRPSERRAPPGPASPAQAETRVRGVRS